VIKSTATKEIFEQFPSRFVFQELSSYLGPENTAKLAFGFFFFALLYVYLNNFATMPGRVRFFGSVRSLEFRFFENLRLILILSFCRYAITLLVMK
jgi:hypothetical protein